MGRDVRGRLADLHVLSTFIVDPSVDDLSIISGPIEPRVVLFLEPLGYLEPVFNEGVQVRMAPDVTGC